ncbi:uridine kinase family protein [Tessaracoccus sp. Y36]|uniref:uridine kinase family protein n=1 Tax=Tessaracoccus sp. MC1756 TaxID=2760311 RepID=UPI0016031722|nr:uridine kinase [Tessaracoccus sp. MC1756]MBB1509407.1 uridine kinase [Tessaracoccus sp. MC1756]
MVRTLVLIAGPSGSGKSRITSLAADGEHVVALSLDDFYRDLDHPDLPMTPMGIPDWDDVACWDMELAVDTLRTLLRDGRAELPVYDISLSRRVGTRTVDLGTAQIVLAEGIFAIQALAAARAEGLTVEALWLDRRRAANFLRRLARDLKEHRKPPVLLLRRGWALYRSEPALRRAALAAGFRGMSMRRALGSVKRR